ncbi:MAG TPA: hypothetical protein VF329_04190 [Gammaproteobacteria bacterium]
MSDQRRSSDLEISEDMEFQRRTWIVERFGWAVLALIVVAAILGLFGKGLLGHAEATAADGTLTVEYYRFWRMQSPMMVGVAAQTVPTGDRARIWMDRAYVESVQVDRITPEPESVEAAADRLIYVFALAHAGEPLRATFEVEPQRPWRVRGRVGVEGGEMVMFSQFVYP